ncbi:MAG: outer membrane protein assembly factor BamB [Neolewinella sp.]|jgi:outer membrane protein assembly factor BamB
MLTILAALIPSLGVQGVDWPQWRGPTRDGVWTESDLLESLPDELTPRWRTEIGAGYSGPTVAGGKVYVMDRLDEPTEVERVHCFEWDTGKPIWTHEYACSYAGVSYKAGPRCSVHIVDDLAYSLGTMGNLFCFQAATGEIVWQKDLKADYAIEMPIWGISASPVIEGDRLIVPVSGKDAWLVAFDRKTGKEQWQAFSDRGNYSAPIIIDQAGKRVLVCWSGDRVIGASPETGALYWEYPLKARNMPLACATPLLHDDKLFLTAFYDGCATLQLDQTKTAVEEVWRRRGPNERRTDGLHSIISTPIAIDKHIYGVDSYGEFRCLALADGSRVWEDKTAVPRKRWATIHFVKNGEHVWMFNERGELLIGKLTPKGFEEIDRGKLIEPTRGQLNRRGGVCWSHPAFAYKHVFARNDKELVCADLSAPETQQPKNSQPVKK